MMRLMAGLLLAGLAATTAGAQRVCMRYHKLPDGTTARQPDRETAYLFQQRVSHPDPRVMQALVGTWYGETRNPATGQMLYGYDTYGPLGQYDYRQRVCTPQGYCSDYQGAGQFAGVLMPNGTISLILAYSDLSVADACVASNVSVGNGQMRNLGTGGVSRKVR